MHRRWCRCRRSPCLTPALARPLPSAIPARTRGGLPTLSPRPSCGRSRRSVRACRQSSARAAGDDPVAICVDRARPHMPAAAAAAQCEEAVAARRSPARRGERGTRRRRKRRAPRAARNADVCSKGLAAARCRGVLAEVLRAARRRAVVRRRVLRAAVAGANARRIPARYGVLAAVWRCGRRRVAAAAERQTSCNPQGPPMHEAHGGARESNRHAA